MKTHVLIIEDDEIDQIALKRHIDHELPGLQYCIARSLQEANELLQQKKFDLIISDFSLGDGTAFDLLSADLETPFILITGHGTEETAQKAFKQGAKDYLIKQSNQSHLRNLSNVIENSLVHFQSDQKNRMLSMALDGIHDSVYITDLDHNIIYVNQVFLDHYGYQEHEILHKNANLLCSPITPANEESWFTYKTHSPTCFHKRKDGVVFPVSLSKSVFIGSYKSAPHVITVVHNLTDQKKKEEELLDIIHQYKNVIYSLEEENELLIRKLMETRQNEPTNLKNERRQP